MIISQHTLTISLDLNQAHTSRLPVELYQNMSTKGMITAEYVGRVKKLC